MQTIFAQEFHGGDPEAILEYITREFESRVSDLSFAYELLNGVLAHLEESRKLIQKYAPQWPIDKIAPLDRAILEVGIFEVMHAKDVPPVVAVDEAIELAKSFGNENSKKFINGVLNAVLENRGTSPRVGEKN